jgi:KAP family P-loop domain
MNNELRDKIWEGDRLSRRHEAETIEKYVVRETATFARLGRPESIVLGIDAPYGRGKTWFLERLARQLELSHPVARINAWADDVGDEPLTAFMASIDEALAPYLSKSKKLGDRMAAAKAAALPVIGKLVSGALFKAVSKVAGDEIDEQLGFAIEEAIRGTNQKAGGAKEGAAATAMETVLDKLGTEIDTLVDRRGAAMLAAYQQRKKSRELFRKNMRELVASIDASTGRGKAPLIVIIDELDRCRPHYALRMLEEIKHFFEVPGVVFILGLHGGQLSKSIKAVYGAEFDGDDYLRRFFTRRYELRPHSVVELAASIFLEWGMDEAKFKFPEPIVSEGYQLTNPRLIGLILAQWLVSPREIFAVMDGLRLFVDGWEHPDPIEPMAILGMLVHLVRGDRVDTAEIGSNNQLRLRGMAVTSPNGDGRIADFKPNNYLSSLSPLAWNPLSEISRERGGTDAARNYLIAWLQNEWQVRRARKPQSEPHQSHIADYIPRIAGLARFITDTAPE